MRRETRAQREQRRYRLARLDWLLFCCEEHNWLHDGESAAPLWLAQAAARAGCWLRGPITGARLHAALLERQGVMMRPVYVRRGARLRDEDGAIPVIAPSSSDELHEIDVWLREIA